MLSKPLTHEKWKWEEGKSSLVVKNIIQVHSNDVYYTLHSPLLEKPQKCEAATVEVVVVVLNYISLLEKTAQCGKFENFSETQILREIKFGNSRG